MSIDTQLNITAVILAAVAVIGVIACFVFIMRSRREISDVKATAQASKVTLNGFPKSQEQMLASMSRVLAEADRLTTLLGEEADQREVLKNLATENTELRRLNGTLEYKVGVLEGEKVMLNEMTTRQTSVVNSQKAQIDKSLVAIRELTAVTERQQALIEELTRALPDRQGA